MYKGWPSHLSYFINNRVLNTGIRSVCMNKLDYLTSIPVRDCNSGIENSPSILITKASDTGKGLVFSRKTRNHACTIGPQTKFFWAGLY